MARGLSGMPFMTYGKTVGVFLLGVCLNVVFYLPLVAAQENAIQPNAGGIPKSKVVTGLPFKGGIPTYVNGKGPFMFGLDSGVSGGAWVSPELVKELNLPVVRQVTVQDRGSSGKEAGYVQIDSLTLGAVSFSNVFVPVVPISPKGVDGTLGLGLFRDYVLTLDYPGDKLTISDGELPGANGKNILNYTGEQGQVYVPVRLGALETTAQIDSRGSTRQVLVPLSLASQLPLTDKLVHVGEIATSPSHTVPLYVATLNGELAIGDLKLTNPRLLCSDKLTHVILGRDFVRSVSISFDQKNRRVRIGPH